MSGQFRKNKDLVDAQAVHEAKQACVCIALRLLPSCVALAPCHCAFLNAHGCVHRAERVLSNYFLFEHLQCVSVPSKARSSATRSHTSHARLTPISCPSHTSRACVPVTAVQEGPQAQDGPREELGPD